MYFAIMLDIFAQPAVSVIPGPSPLGGPRGRRGTFFHVKDVFFVMLYVGEMDNAFRIHIPVDICFANRRPQKYEYDEKAS